ncbi:MAG TPA: FAD-dependent oxidoreductase [Ignavibacteriaceae bacterium]|nr:FAD-dependent oxidoreductase [Ignavibacteriaceae bacterium]
MIRPKEILVIGGNAAGPAAAAKAKRINPDANVKMFEAGEYISTGTCEIPYVFSGEIKNYKDLIFYNPKTFREKKGVDVYIKHRVEEINRLQKEIKVLDLYNGTIHFYKYDKLILATGAYPKQLKQFSFPAKNLFTFKDISDLINIQNYIRENNVKNIFIIGSGYIGIEAAEVLNTFGFNITLIEKENHPLPAVETEVQLMIEDMLKKNHVRFFGGVKNQKPVYGEDKIININTDGRIIETDLVIVSIGFHPNTDLAKKAKLEIGEYGGISVDATLKTSDPHIFAAGDCIEIINEITNRPFYLPLATVTHDYAHIAGENAAGNNRRVNNVVKNISIKLWDKYLISVGLSSSEAKENKIKFKFETATAYNKVKVIPNSREVYGKLLYETDSKKIIGASFLGGEEVSGYGDLISALIRTKQSAKILAEINYNYTPPLSPYINLLSLLGRKIS